MQVRQRVIRTLLIALVLLGASACKSTVSDIPCLQHGIDLSHHNTVKDWSKVEAAFIYLKATEGATIKDAKYKAYSAAAWDRNIPVGAYHFLTTASSAKDQFENFKKMVPKGTFDLIPVLDVEKKTKGHPVTSQQWHDLVKDWVKLCKSYYGVKPIIYSTLRIYLDNHLDDLGCEFWCGNLTKDEHYLDGEDYVIWQSEMKPSPGIVGKVDYNYFAPGKSLEDLKMR